MSRKQDKVNTGREGYPQHVSIQYPEGRVVEYESICQAAASMGMSKSWMYYKMQTFGNPFVYRGMIVKVLYE